MRTKLFSLVAAFPIALATSCGGSTPVDFAGTYTVTIVNGANTCNLMNWTAGDSTAGIPVTFTQDGTTAQMQVGGLTAVYLDLVLGTATFSGSVSGDTFNATFLGTKQVTQTTCSYTVNTKLAVTLSSNSTISGTLTYIPVTNNDPACGALNACAGQTQTVSGSRTGM